MEHVLTMANWKLKPSLFTPRPNTHERSQKLRHFLSRHGAKNWGASVFHIIKITVVRQVRMSPAFTTVCYSEHKHA